MRYDDIAAAAHKGKAGKMTKRGLTAMRNRTTLLRAEQSRAEQSRAEQSRAEQSRAEQSVTAPFLRLARCLKLNTILVNDNRHT